MTVGQRRKAKSGKLQAERKSSVLHLLGSRAFGDGPSFVYGKRSSIDIFSIQQIYRLPRFWICHLDKSKSFSAAGRLVTDDHRAIDGSTLCEEQR
jgi:hypothetical protein